LSDPLEEDEWTGHTGFIHEVALINDPENHPRLHVSLLRVGVYRELHDRNLINRGRTQSSGSELFIFSDWGVPKRKLFPPLIHVAAQGLYMDG
jgi:hypothetical protein